MDGDRFEQRDRHHTIVRERLQCLKKMGLVRPQVDLDDEGVERRSVVSFLPVTPVNAEQLAAAADRLAAWQRRYGAALNTASSCEVRNANGHGRPLDPHERQRRGIAHTKATAAARARRGQSAPETDSAPPAGALRNDHLNRQRSELRHASHRSGVTRASAHARRNVDPALEPPSGSKNSGIEEEGVGSPEGRRLSEKAPERASAAAERLQRWQDDPDAMMAEIRARAQREAEWRRPMADRAQRRALLVAGWGTHVPWPRAELRNAWMVSRYGPSSAVEWSPSAAGPLTDMQLQQLRRAVERYERYRPALADDGADTPWEGWPHRGIATLLHLGALSAAGQLHDGPQLLFVAIERLDRISKQIRAAATADDPAHRERARRRALRRRTPPPARPGPFSLPPRGQRRWPAWILLDGAKSPTFDADGRLQLDPELVELYAPAPHTDMWRRTLRDAYLLARQPLPVQLDSRRLMRARDRGEIPRTRRADDRLASVELRELAHLTGMPVAQLERVSLEVRRDLLEHHRRQAAKQQVAEAASFREMLDGIDLDGAG